MAPIRKKGKAVAKPAPHKYTDLRTYFHVLPKEQRRSRKSTTNVIDHEKISVDEDQSDEDTPIFQKTEVWEEPDKSDEDYEEYQEAMTRRIAALTALFDNRSPFREDIAQLLQQDFAIL